MVVSSQTQPSNYFMFVTARRSIERNLPMGDGKAAGSAVAGGARSKGNVGR
jgi:hypothetical protein